MKKTWKKLRAHFKRQMSDRPGPRWHIAHFLRAVAQLLLKDHKIPRFLYWIAGKLDSQQVVPDITIIRSRSFRQ